MSTILAVIVASFASALPLHAATSVGSYASTQDSWNQYVTPQPTATTSIHDYVSDHWPTSFADNNAASVASASGTDSLNATLDTGPKTIGLPITWTTAGHAQASSSASYGTLHAAANAHAEVPQSSYTYQYTDSENISHSGTLWNPFAIVSQSGAFAGWEDTFTITSATLPKETPVTLSMSVILSSAVQSPQSGTSAGAGIYQAGYPVVTVENYGASPLASKDVTFGAYVGSTFTLQGRLAVQAQANAFAWRDFTGRDSTIPLSVAQADATANASNTGHFYIDSLTPDVAITTTSGASYATPTPEPASLLLLAGMGAPLLLRRPRRA